jgi:hypothetical protein
VSLLSEVIVEIQRTMKYVPKLSGNMAWRLHPDDMTIVAEEVKQYAYEHDHALMKDMYIMGVRIFPDLLAPRLGSDNAKDSQHA